MMVCIAWEYLRRQTEYQNFYHQCGISRNAWNQEECLDYFIINPPALKGETLEKYKQRQSIPGIFLLTKEKLPGFGFVKSTVEAELAKRYEIVRETLPNPADQTPPEFQRSYIGKIVDSPIQRYLKELFKSEFETFIKLSSYFKKLFGKMKSELKGKVINPMPQSDTFPALVNVLFDPTLPLERQLRAAHDNLKQYQQYLEITPANQKTNIQDYITDLRIWDAKQAGIEDDEIEEKILPSKKSTEYEATRKRIHRCDQRAKARIRDEYRQIPAGRFFQEKNVP